MCFSMYFFGFQNFNVFLDFKVAAGNGANVTLTHIPFWISMYFSMYFLDFKVSMYFWISKLQLAMAQVLH